LFQHPQLTMGQIYAALAYYSDHQEKMDALIKQQLEELERLSSRIRQPEDLISRIRKTKKI